MWIKFRTKSQYNVGNNSFESDNTKKLHACRNQTGNACYHSFQNHVSSHLLTKNRRIKMYNFDCCLKFRLSHWGRNKGWEFGVFRSRVLGKIVGSKRQRLKFHNEEFCDFCSWPNIIQMIPRMRWVAHVICMMERSIQSFSGKTLGKETTWRPRHMCKDYFKINLRETG